MMDDGKRTSFTKEDFLPKTGSPWPDDSSDMLAAEATVLACFDGIYIVNHRHLPVFVALEQLRQLGIAQPGQRKRALRVLAPSGAGKTTTVMAYAAKVEERLPEDERAWRRPVVILPIHPKIKVKGWWSALLQVLGEQISRPRDTEETLRLRASEAIARSGVELLVIDEAQHLAVTTKMIGEVTDRMKRFLDDGVVPVVFVGTSDAKEMLQSNLQLVNRMLPPADIVSLRSENTKDRRELEHFLKRLDAEIVARKLMAEPAGLDETLVAACLMQIAGGNLGRIVNLLRLALGRAYRRQASRIEPVDLQAATALWAVGQGVITKNPFTPENQ
jgi:DNA transposition AAA+ family ATPase